MINFQSDRVAVFKAVIIIILTRNIDIVIVLTAVIKKLAINIIIPMLMMMMMMMMMLMLMVTAAGAMAELAVLSRIYRWLSRNSVSLFLARLRGGLEVLS